MGSSSCFGIKENADGSFSVDSVYGLLAAGLRLCAVAANYSPSVTAGLRREFWEFTTAVVCYREMRNTRGVSVTCNEVIAKTQLVWVWLPKQPTTQMSIQLMARAGTRKRRTRLFEIQFNSSLLEGVQLHDYPCPLPLFIHGPVTDATMPINHDNPFGYDPVHDAMLRREGPFARAASACHDYAIVVAGLMAYIPTAIPDATSVSVRAARERTLDVLVDYMVKSGSSVSRDFKCGRYNVSINACTVVDIGTGIELVVRRSDRTGSRVRFYFSQSAQSDTERVAKIISKAQETLASLPSPLPTGAPSRFVSLLPMPAVSADDLLRRFRLGLLPGCRLMYDSDELVVLDPDEDYAVYRGSWQSLGEGALRLLGIEPPVG